MEKLWSANKIIQGLQIQAGEKLITKVGFQGGAWFGKHFYLIFFLLLGAMILLVTVLVETFPEANADKSEHHKHYCYEQQYNGCIETEGCNATTCGGKDDTKKDAMEAEDEQELDSLNDQILKQKEEITKAEKAILDQKKLAGENFIKMNQAIAEEKSLKQEYRNLSKQIQQKKFECRDIQAFGNYTATNALRKECNKELDDMKEDYKKTFDEWKQSLIDKKTTNQDYWDAYDEIQVTINYHKEQVDKHNDLKALFRNTMAKTNIISLRISGTCEMTIERHWKATQLDPEHYNSSQCLTYRDLVGYDNSIKAISGEFEDLGWDLNRMKPGIANTYEYYKQFPWAKWIIVDPDGSILSNSAVITVQPQNVQWLKAQFESNKSESIDFDKMEQYVMEDIMVSEDCRFASVSPKIEAVNNIVSHFMKHCTPPIDSWERTIKLVVLEGLGIIDEQSKQAMNWYAKQAREIAMQITG